MALFPRFHELWCHSLWKDVLAIAVDWYIQALRCLGKGARNVQGVVLGMIALEMLSSVICVEDGRLVSPAGFGKLPAADRIRMMLTYLEIPVALRYEEDEVGKLAKEKNWIDGVECVCQLRNSVVHMVSKNRAKLSEFSGVAQYQVCRLALLYLESTLLRLLGYHEAFYSRRSGCKEKPAWASSPVWHPCTP